MDYLSVDAARSSRRWHGLAFCSIDSALGRSQLHVSRAPQIASPACRQLVCALMREPRKVGNNNVSNNRETLAVDVARRRRCHTCYIEAAQLQSQFNER
jgi:hypothetical protein